MNLQESYLGHELEFKKCKNGLKRTIFNLDTEQVFTLVIRHSLLFIFVRLEEPKKLWAHCLTAIGRSPAQRSQAKASAIFGGTLVLFEIGK